MALSRDDTPSGVVLIDSGGIRGLRRGLRWLREQLLRLP